MSLAFRPPRWSFLELENRVRASNTPLKGSDFVLMSTFGRIGFRAVSAAFTATVAYGEPPFRELKPRRC